MKNLIKTIAVLTVLAFNSLKAQNNNIPVTVVSEDGAIILQWNTQKEVNSSYFVIESSADNQSFGTVAKVKAAGYSVTNKNYEFEGLNASLNYRVTLVSMGGERSTSLVVNAGSRIDENVLAHK